MPAALARPLVARKLVELAGLERAAAVAHGAGADRPIAPAGLPVAADPLDPAARLHLAIRALSPGLTVLAPARDAGLTAAAKAKYVRERGLYAPAPDAARTDANLWGRSLQGLAPDPAAPLPHGFFIQTRPPEECPGEAADVRISFAQGVPVAINGVTMPLVDLIASLATIAAAHGVGRIDGVEHGPGGRTRVICEAPAAVVLHTARRWLQQVTLPPDLDRFLQLAALEYAALVREGRWFTPVREALDALVGRARTPVAGTVRLQLLKGGCRVLDSSPAQPPASGASREGIAAATAAATSRAAAEAAATSPHDDREAGEGRSQRRRLVTSR
jgi:argininosuccinate synthase